MSLAEAYDDLNTDQPFPQCKTCKWYASLNDADLAFFNSKAANLHKGGPGKLLRACKAAGLDVTRSSFRNHLIEHHHQVHRQPGADA